MKIVVPVDGAAHQLADDNFDIGGRWDRLNTAYLTFKQQLDTLLNERIPRQFRHLNFREMRMVTQTNLRTILDDIDGKN